MPCYQVQMCNVNLENINLDRLEKVMKKMGYSVRRTGKTLYFSKGPITGGYDGTTISMSGGQQETMYAGVNAIKRSYSEDVVQEKGAKMRQKGWYLVKQQEEGKYKLQRTPPPVQVRA